MEKRKRIVAFVLLLVLVMMIGNLTAFADQTVIRYMTWEDSDWQTLTKEYIEQFEAENPDIKIQYEPVAGEGYAAKLTAELASGSGPDICWVDNWTTTFETGVFYPLNDLVKSTGYDLSYVDQNLIDMCTYNGNLYGLCGWMNSAMINYNKDLFDEAGVDYPEAGWTWEDCYAAAEKITNGQGGEKIYGIYMQNWAPFYENVAWSNGGEIIDENNDYHVMASEENAKALKFFASFEKNGLSPDESTVQANGGLIDMFTNGKIAMIYFFPNVVVSAKNFGTFDLDKLGIVPVPVSQNDLLPAANILFTNPICISASSKNPEAAFKFLSGIVGREHQTEFCKRGYGLPADSRVITDIGLDKDLHLSIFIDPVLNPENYAATRTYLSYSPVAGVISTEIQNAVSRVIETDQDPMEALKEAVINIDSQNLA